MGEEGEKVVTRISHGLIDGVGGVGDAVAGAASIKRDYDPTERRLASIKAQT